MRSSKPDKGSFSIMKLLSSQNLDSIRKNPSDFQDEFFPPTENSLYSEKKDIKSLKIPEIPKFLKDKNTKFLSQFAMNHKDGRYGFFKLNEFLDANHINICKNEKTFQSDIVQGELGDCYFLSVLSALAAEPENIKALVDADAKGNDKAFQAHVYIHGEPVSVVIDNNFPVSNGTKFAFAGLNRNTGNIWPMILEKAWAKVNKSYEDIIPGNSADALEFLTPAPIDTYYHSQESAKLFEIIQNAKKNKCIILADITDTANTNLESLSQMGLITNHAYSVIDTAVLKRQLGSEIHLVKMKNLWGTNEWLGDWSDGSLKWTQEFKKTVGLEEKEDGIFWMSFEDYLQFYTTTHICQHKSKYNYKFAKFSTKEDFENSYNISKIIVNTEGSGYFTVNLKNTRIYRNMKNKPGYVNPYCSMTVFRKDNDGFVFVGSDSGKQDRLYVQCLDMHPGVYFVAVTFPKSSRNFTLVERPEVNENAKNFRVGVYSSVPNLRVEKVSSGEGSDVFDFLFNMINNLAQENENKYVFSQEGENDTFRVINFDNNRNGFGYIFYQNNSDAYLKEKIKLTSLSNVTMVPILKDGYFMSKDKYNPNTSKQGSSKKETKKYTKTTKGGKKIEETIVETITNDEIDYESNAVSKAINQLKGNIIPSSIELITADNAKAVSKLNPAEFQINIAPHCKGIMFLQKTEEEADLDLDSDICFDYLPNIFLTEQKFNQKKYRLRYNNKAVQVYELITEHNTGVFFLYKNRSKDLKLQVTIRFNKHENLYLQLTSSDFEENEGKLRLREYKENAFRDDSDEDTVTLSIKPGQDAFFGLSAYDSFSKFTYSCQCDYLFSLAYAPGNIREAVENEDNVVKDEITEI